ncbi:glycosyltransferase [Aliikangiella sp. G2MR2-5]|uniref:glycosyltransferase n=1 Tax=Aliikangiella sp. G2MR2-5 TaxID=2788943 RepID=UPI0018A9FBF6|nr:glycosyltransferase [Aliikangiella sp. G2MR2-5]
MMLNKLNAVHKIQKLKQIAILAAKIVLGNRYYSLKAFLFQRYSKFSIERPKISESGFTGFINFANYFSSTGWVVDSEGKAVKNFDLYIDGNKVSYFKQEVFRKDIIDAFAHDGDCGFEIQFLNNNNSSFKPSSYLLEIKCSKTHRLIHRTQVNFRCKKTQSRRRNKRTSDVVSMNLTKEASVEVDVVIPVYAGREVTLDCISSVLASKTKIPYRIVIVNDKSPEPDLVSEVRRITGSNSRVVLLENDSNLGFVCSVNKGMKYDLSKDAILLNSDTLVSDYWLDKLVSAAYALPEIATVTPMSNNATIFSLPIPNPRIDYSEPASIDEINKLLEKNASGKRIEVPTAHGFCMYIKRSVLEQIGYFDEEKWGKGYAEENDFSRRAIDAGYINVAACDVYVKHVGSVSFGSSAADRITKNLRKLNRMYPDYLPAVETFIKKDPFRALRNKINEQLLDNAKIEGRRKVLHVTHSLGGGTEYAMQSIIEVSSKFEVQSYILRAEQGGRVWILQNCPQSLCMEFDCLTDLEQLIDVLKKLEINLIHFHQLLEFDRRIFDLPRLLNVSYDIALHDYYLICPRVNMLRDKDEYCGGPSDACLKCVTSYGCHPASNKQIGSEKEYTEYWRLSQQFMNGARKLIAPTKGVQEKFSRCYDGNNIEVKAHPETRIERYLRLDTANQTIKVAILGAIGVHKGVLKLIEILKYAHREKLPIQFVLFGYVSEHLISSLHPNLTITGKYKQSELTHLIDKYGCDRALFLSPWPETFSYTLSEAYEHGLYPIAYDLGAFSDRIPEVGVGELFGAGTSMEELFQLLMNKPLPEISYITGKQYSNFATDYYEF